MAIENDIFTLSIDRWDGLFTSLDADDISDSYSPNVLNARIAGSHFRGTLGYSLIGTRNGNAGEVVRQWTYTKNNGTDVMLRVRDDGSNTILEWYDATNGEWYTLLGGLTTGKVMGYAEFNTSTADQMICCNGVDNMTVWTGNTTRLTAALSGGETTINVSDTTNFPSSGTIIYNGTEIAYSAKTATTFTVASAHASSGADDGVAEAADDSTHSGITKGNILLSAKDRLWIAGQPSAESAVDYSDEGAAFTFTGGANRSDSGAEDILNIGGRVTGLAEKGDEIIVMGPDGAIGFSFVYPTATTKAPNYREIFRAEGRGPTNQKAVFKAGGEVYYASKNGIESISDLEGGVKLVSNLLTRAIQPTLENYDLSEVSLQFFDKEQVLLMACMSDPVFGFNDLTVALEFYVDRNGNNRVGFTRWEWPANDFAVLGDDLYMGSSGSQNSFKCFDTYQHDGAPRTIRYAMKRYNLKNPFQHKTAGLLAVKGYIKDGTSISVNILLNSGFTASLEKTIESDGEYVSSNTLNAIGSFALGTNPIGGTIEDVSELKEFLVYLDIGKDYEWSDIEPVFESDTDGGTFMITHVAATVEEAGYAHIDSLTI